MAEAEFHLHNEAGIRFPPLRPAFSDGDLYFGRFRGLISRATGTSVIGEGGTGRIHFVRDELMDREVALKIPLGSILRDPAARHDVIEETRQAMELTHPNIVRIHDFHEAERLWGISMQYVRGKNLDEWRYEDTGASGHRRTIRPYSVETVRDWIAQLCDALRYAHEDARMVHRDIKPKNLMLERREGTEKLMITDFGITQRLRMHNLMLSRDQDRAGENKGNMGTLPYMPWEQIAGGPPSPLDDIYAVGATIYDLITGRPPFYEGGFEQIKIQIKETAPPRMEQRLADFGIPASPIPEAWEQVVAACLAKRQEDRPQSMRELAAALGFQSGSSTHLEAVIQSQEVRIHELEGRIEALSTAGNEDAQTKLHLAEMEAALAAARNEALEHQRKTQDAEQRVSALSSKLASIEGELADAGKNDDERFVRLKQESAARIKELENDLTKAKEDAGKDSPEVSAELRKKADSLAEKLRGLEAERAKDIAKIREESDKRLKQQAEELHRARQAIETSAAEREALDRQLAAEKNRQAASIRPALIVMLAALALGLGGGFITGKFKSGGGLDQKWVRDNKFPETKEGVDPNPVTWGQFKTFANANKFKVEDLLDGTAYIQSGKWKDSDPVKGVNWLVAQQFCNWLTELAQTKNSGLGYTLPTLKDLENKTLRTEKDTWEWTSDWKEGESKAGFIGFLLKRPDDAVPYPPVAAQPNLTFRVKLAPIPKE